MRVLIDKGTTNYNLRNAREQWLDKLTYKNIKMAKCQEKRRRKQNNIMFQRDQKRFFRTLEEVSQRQRERQERNPYMPWMEEIRRQLNEKVSQVNEFNITFEKVKKEVAKRKGWTAPGINSMQNYWWKRLEPVQKALTGTFTKIQKDNTNIPTWRPTGRTVLLPKTKTLEDEKDYRPITCLNTSYKIMTGVVVKYMRE